MCWARALLLLLVCSSRPSRAPTARCAVLPSSTFAPVAAARRARLRRSRTSQASCPFATLRAPCFARRQRGSAPTARCFALTRPAPFGHGLSALRAQFVNASRPRPSRKRGTARHWRGVFHVRVAFCLGRRKKATPSARTAHRLFPRPMSKSEHSRMRQLRPAAPAGLMVQPPSDNHNQNKYKNLHFVTSFTR